MEVEGIIISVVPYKETGVIGNLLTNQGLITFQAHGVMKINSSLSFVTQLYTKIQAELVQSSKSGHYILKNARCAQDVRHIYGNLEMMVTLGFFVELSRNILDGTNSVDVYILLNEAIDAIIKKKNLLTIRLAFVSQIIILSGLALEITECVRCHSKKEILALSFKDGGFICKNCYHAFEDNVVNTTYIKLTRFVFITPFKEVINKNLPTYESTKLFTNLCHFLFEQSGFLPQSYDLLLKIQK